MYCYSNTPIKSELCFSVWVPVSKNEFFSEKHFLFGLATNKVGFLNVFTPGMSLVFGFSVFSSAPVQPKTGAHGGASEHTTTVSRCRRGHPSYFLEYFLHSSADAIMKKSAGTAKQPLDILSYLCG